MNIRKSLALLVVSVFAVAFAQEEPYQVQGFPPFAPAPKMLEVVEDKGDTVVVRHLMGETEIPKNPQRVYTDASTLQVLTSLGIVPVGSNYEDYQTLPPDLEGRLADTSLVNRSTVNLEAILSLQPDLIIAWDITFMVEDAQVLYEQLIRIAPTVILFENPFTFWEQATRDVGAALGLESEADAVLTSFQESVNQSCDIIRNTVGDETLSVLSVYRGHVDLSGPGYETSVLSSQASATGYIPIARSAWAYLHCRLQPGPELIRLVGTTESTARLSYEVLPELEADHLVITVLSDAVDTYEEFTQHPLWSSIPAVQNGQVYRLDYVSGSGYYSTLWTLEQAADIITAESD